MGILFLIKNQPKDLFNSTESTNLALNFGNFNNIKSSGVLRKVKFDLSSLQRYTNDNWSE